MAGPGPATGALLRELARHHPGDERRALEFVGHGEPREAGCDFIDSGRHAREAFGFLGGSASSTTPSTTTSGRPTTSSPWSQEPCMCRPDAGAPRTDPPVVNQPDRHRVQKMQLLPAGPARDNDAGGFEHTEMLHDAEACHRQLRFELRQRLATTRAGQIEKVATRRIRQCLEDAVVVHAPNVWSHVKPGCGALRQRPKISSRQDSLWSPAQPEPDDAQSLTVRVRHATS